MTLTSSLQPSTSSGQTPPKNKSQKTKCTLHIPKLCDIYEDIKLPTQSPNQSIDEFPLALNPDANVFIPSFTKAKNTPKYKKMIQFTTKFKPRAKLNIYIPKKTTKQLLPTLHESFPNTSTLYYYLDVSTALQIADKQMYIFQTVCEPTVVFINFDLHKKGNNQLLYGVVLPNDKDKIQKCNKPTDNVNTKWLWKLDTFLTAKQIYHKYGITVNDLPKSSRSIHNLNQHIQPPKINANILYDTNWTKNDIPIISKQFKKAKNTSQHCSQLHRNAWINSCIRTWNNMPAIPVIVYGNKSFWIEWVKLVYIAAYKSYVGISFKQCENTQTWKLQSVYLDKSDIFNKHCLFGCMSNYNGCFDKFDISITQIQWF